MADLQRLPWRLRYADLPKLASHSRRLGVLATHRHADVHIDPSARLGPRFSVWIPEHGHLSIGAGSQLRRDFYAEIYGDGNIEIGPGAIFTGACQIQVTTSLVIGPRAMFGFGTFIVDGNHRFKDHTRHMLDQGFDYSPLTVGEGAAVMTKCTIMASLGKGAVIAANSVVTKPIPDYCIAMGAPARVVEYYGPADQAPAAVFD
jgi:acetyltransferase-like isoleucine patch superfamily enzyme